MINASTIAIARRRRTSRGMGGRLASEIVAPAAGSAPRHSLQAIARSDPAAPSSKQEFARCIRPRCSSPIAPRASAFAEARGFGIVCAWNGKRPVASSLPFYLSHADDGTPQALFHVARHNPLATLADGTTSWLLAVNGADAYVSPDWYVSPDQVPTWLYQSVHLTGPVRKLSRRRTRRASRSLSAKFEGWLAPKPPWTSAKMTAGRLEAMKKAIVGLVMTIEDVEGSFKLNQHKSDADYAAVAHALAALPDAGLASHRAN